MVKVNQDKCIGCGTCVAICPEVFELEDDGKARVKNFQSQSPNSKSKEAAESCPVGAIEIDS